jgi:MoxR-like ATPase
MPTDISHLAVDVLAHRLVLTYEALADGVSGRSVVERVLQVVPVPHVAPSQDVGAA